MPANDHTNNFNKKNRELKNILLNIPGCVYWKDIYGVYMGCNRVFLEMAGLEYEDELIGKTDYQLCWRKEADVLTKHDKAVIEQGIVQSIEEEVTLRNGESKLYSVVKSPLYDEDGEVIGIVGTSIDISYRRELENNLIREKIRAEAASKAKSEFIANMSHDIKTPITGIIGLANNILQITNQDEIKEDIQTLLSTVDKLLHLQNEVISITYTDTVKVNDDGEYFSLNSLIDNNIKLLGSAIKTSKIEIKTNYDKNNSEIKTHRYYLDKIILNLLSNAVKFTENGEIQVTTKIDTDLNKVIITVADNGIGIPTDKLKEIFDCFTRVHPSYTGKYDGYGIGLYMVNNFVNRLQGKISVKSQEGIGSEFTIEVPVSISSFKETLTATEDEIGPHLYCDKSIKQISIISDKNNFSYNDKVNVLVVEDNRLAGLMAIRLLQDNGFHVDLAKSGEEALELVNKCQYDIVFMDIGLPGIDGIETTRKIRDNTNIYQMYICALSGHLSPECESECKKSGMNCTLSKPLTRSHISQVLEEILCEN